MHNREDKLSMNEHLQQYASQVRQKSQHPTHPLHYITTKQETLRLKKQTTPNYTTDIKHIHTTIVNLYPNHKVLTALPMATQPKVMSLTLDTKLTYSTHIHNISVQAHTPLQMIIKALAATWWGKQMENKHSHRPPHSHYNRNKNKHAPYTYIHCL